MRGYRNELREKIVLIEIDDVTLDCFFSIITLSSIIPDSLTSLPYHPHKRDKFITKSWHLYHQICHFVVSLHSQLHKKWYTTPTQLINTEQMSVISRLSLQIYDNLWYRIRIWYVCDVVGVFCNLSTMTNYINE